jgi:hypothetical protein
MNRLKAEARAEYEQITGWIRELYDQPDARQQIESRLLETWSVTRERVEERGIANWTHRRYAIPLRTEFEGDRLVAHSARGGSMQRWKKYPQPVRVAISSPAESVRRFIAAWVGWLWLAALAITILSRRYGLIAAEAMLAISLVCGAAWAVAPNYTLTVQGVFSNDPLFFAAVMYLSSLVCLALRLAPRLDDLDRSLRLRFRIRTLLIATGVIAAFLAMGTFGYFALLVLTIGACIFAVILQWQHRARTAHRITP